MGFSRQAYWSGLPFPPPVRKYEVSEVKLLSRVRLFATPRTVAYQAPPSMGFSRQEYWSELPFPSPGDLSNPGIEPGSSALQTDAFPSKPLGKPRIPKKGNAKECSNYRTIALISQDSKVKLLSHVQVFATPWTVAYQAPPSMGFSRQEYWSGLPFPSPGDLPNPGIEPGSPSL